MPLQAWVRAPDLAPGTIIQGDARLKLTAGCTAVESALLGLRFKERSFVKASRFIELAKRPKKEKAFVDMFDPESASPSSPWVLPVLDDLDHCIADFAFGVIEKNRDVWLVREEERIVFGSTRVIDMEETHPGSVRDVVRDFAIIVPSTNFPPALDYPHSHVGLRKGEFVNVETIYEYFVRVTFTNGTTAEIPAGFTAFHPLYESPNINLVRSKAVQLQTKEESLDESLVDRDSVANYTAKIISEHDGFAFSQGSDDQFVKVVITRTGRARTFVEPLNLHLCIDSSISPKWASEYTSDPTLQSLDRPSQILRADQIAAGKIVTTTSQPVQFLIDADPRHVTDFETCYHTLSSVLFLSLEVPRTQDEPPNMEDVFELRAMRKKTPEVEPDEEAWVPWYNVPEVTRWRGARTYTGNVSVSVYPTHEALLPRHCVRAAARGVEEASEQVVVVAESNEDCSECALSHAPVHYLSNDARAPTFVDGSAMSVRALRAKTAAERDAFAPFLAPLVSFLAEGEERVHRYYRVPEGHRPLIYVGETWVKKVAHRDEHKVTASRPDAMSSVLAKMAAAMKHVFDEL